MPARIARGIRGAYRVGGTARPLRLDPLGSRAPAPRGSRGARRRAPVDRGPAHGGDVDPDTSTCLGQPMRPSSWRVRGAHLRPSERGTQLPVSRSWPPTLGGQPPGGEHLRALGRAVTHAAGRRFAHHFRGVATVRLMHCISQPAEAPLGGRNSAHGPCVTRRSHVIIARGRQDNDLRLCR